jgi:hypothetical protein
VWHPALLNYSTDAVVLTRTRAEYGLEIMKIKNQEQKSKSDKITKSGTKSGTHTQSGLHNLIDGLQREWQNSCAHKRTISVTPPLDVKMISLWQSLEANSSI